MSASKAGLSKSLILKGIQCQKALWLAKNPPPFELPERPDLQATFRMGTEVGILAQDLFPGGTEVPFEGLSFNAQLAKTKELMAAGAEVIYEASFLFDGVFVKVDLLVRDGQGDNSRWQIHEVKMGTAVKEVNLDDVAVQYYVLTQNGLSVSRCFLVHIDNTYVRKGAIRVGKLFASKDVTAEAIGRQKGLPALIADLRKTLGSEYEPKIDIGLHCNDPYECDYIPYCWRRIPKGSIFDLRGTGIDKFDYYNRGIVRLKDLPLDKLNGKQRQQVEATLTRQDSVNPKGVKTFLDTLWYPLCHLDFETFNSPIPKFNGTRPYQQVPFQYSLHIQAHAGSEPQHFEFLAQPGVDPRRELIEQLLEVIPEDACILTYNQAFEKSVLRNLVGLFPDLAEAIKVRVANVRDLMVPFRKRDVYRWQMRGSYSIKEVLPAMVPELSYAGMEIANGMAAMQAYHEMCAMEAGEGLEQLRRAMLEYCRLDTLAMVKILEELEHV